MILIICLCIGIGLGLAFNFHIPGAYIPFMAISILAALDSVFGGILASIEKKFKVWIFITGFFSNALLAAGLTYIGKLLDVDLYFAALIVFGARLFQNLATIRRLLLKRFIKKDII